MQFRTSCGAVNLLISRAPPRNFAPVLIMYDQILTKNPARPGGREREEGKRKKEGSRVLTTFSGRSETKIHDIRSNNCRPGFEELKPLL